ncbi:MAG: D-alanyl-D-alanine carboxypeptidase/D-alanyl-D-alanine-endopeptidase [Spirochaetae bacterium HGW-Spirochaetae-5]|nr:MAG: D-alanyl-D-alanine carboxypeptidase/D-alanyl-D-alanine-endopeptidase [Spirochaetae bacterium HGW-Spirochaetae-5]
MNTKNPPIKHIKSNIEKTFITLILLILITTGCKVSYDDIHFADFKGKPVWINGFNQENYGYMVYDTADDKIVMGHNIRKEFTPASVTKLFTALFAAETLGTDYTFPTVLSYDGSIKGNTLEGDLYIKGSGDPELSLDGLLSLINGLKLKKIKEVKGNFYFDESSFQAREELDKDMPSYAYYNAGISPLTFNSSIIYALPKRDSKWKIVSADLIPSLSAFDSYIYTDNLSYPFLKFRLTGNKEIWGLHQKSFNEKRVQLPVKRPGLYTAETFRRLCTIHGIKIPDPVGKQTPSDSKTISSHESSPLGGILKNMLFSSNNMTAELVYTISAALYKNNDINTNPMEQFYSSNFTGLNWKNFKIANASGLTTLNRTTPEQTCAVLLYIDKKNSADFRLEDILPLSGWDGTMKGRLDSPEAAFRVYGKTGSIFYSSGLAGVFYGASGKRYIYSIYINDPDKRIEYDKNKDKTIEDLNNGGAWTKKAADSIDEFMLKIIKEL